MPCSNYLMVSQSPETVWQHFKEAETMKADFPALIEGLHAPRDLQLFVATFRSSNLLHLGQSI